jgi:tetratricopeptide (TPR) repeat protein
LHTPADSPPEALFSDPEGGTPFHDLLRAAFAELSEGRVERAFSVYQEAYQLAAGDSLPIRRDEAQVGMAAALIEMGRPLEAERGLRQILLAANSTRLRWYTSYQLSRIASEKTETDRALFFAFRCLALAQELAIASFLVASHNRIANLLIFQSDFSRARQHYERALALIPPVSVERFYEAVRTALYDNLGYCLVVLGEALDGLVFLHRAEQRSRQDGTRHLLPEIEQDLAYGYLHLGDFIRARGHAERALDEAQAQRSARVEKNVLVVLCQIHIALGEKDGRYQGYLSRLGRFFPGIGDLERMMREFDFVNAINFRAQ